MRITHSWTFTGLMLAFAHLVVSYCLLCLATLAFLLSKVLSFIELSMPCPCTGFFGYQNSNVCFHELLIEWPVSKISYVMGLVTRRFPFDSVSVRDQSCNLQGENIRGRLCGDRIFEVDGEVCSGFFSGARLDDRIDGQTKYDAKGMTILNQKQKSGIRRRRRASLGYGKLSSASSSIGRIGIAVSRPPCNGNEISESLDPSSGIDYGPLDDGMFPNGIDCGERIGSSIGSSGSYGKRENIRRDSSSIGNFTSNAENSQASVGKDENPTNLLEHALEEERYARVVLYQELEKERAAAASAADEAMAMIFRLQEEKAAVEMEVRQYQRMIDEKFTYDEEEMDILKEILIRREKENHFLQKELEAYRQELEDNQEVDFSESEQLDCYASSKVNSSGQRPLLSVDSNAHLSQRIENSKFIGDSEVLVTENFSSTYAPGEGIMSNHKELTSDLANSDGLVQNFFNGVQTDSSARDVSMVSLGMMTPQAHSVNEEEVGKDEEHCNEEVHGSFPETEPTVYDVHVICDKTIVWKEDDQKESGAQGSSALDSSGWSGNQLSDCQSTSLIDIRPNQESHLDTSSQMSVSDNSRCKTLSIDTQRNPPSAADSERLKLDTEIEWLRERLRIVQEGKEKLPFSTGQMEKVNAQLKVVEDIMNQLRAIQQLREPLRQASLPPSYPKVHSKRRRSQSASMEKRLSRSVSLETFDSA